MKEALIVIDMQEVFFRLPENHLYDKDRLVERVNKLIGQARAKGMPVVFVQHTEQDERDELYEGGEDWQIHRGMDREEGDPVFRKTKWDAFYQTGLEAYLREHGIERLVLTGAQTEFCMDTTLRAAYSLGFQRNRLFKGSHSTLNSKVLSAEQIISHHENVWNGRFVAISEGDLA
ncbi:cysteine hydrolase family protein [Cohnella suwonensis]|uniref:Cysteine hydrolase family protein n=1 Tax=Cohnella suwonensis TaxID=696072 RepID=A0ABW0M1A4_9BACL